MNRIATAIVRGIKFQKYSKISFDLNGQIAPLLAQVKKTLLSEVDNPSEIKDLISSLEEDPEQAEAQRILSDLIAVQQKSLSLKLASLAEDLIELVFDLQVTLEHELGFRRENVTGLAGILIIQETEFKRGYSISGGARRPDVKQQVDTESGIDIDSEEVTEPLTEDSPIAGDFQILLQREFGGSKPQNVDPLEQIDLDEEVDTPFESEEDDVHEITTIEKTELKLPKPFLARVRPHLSPPSILQPAQADPAIKSWREILEEEMEHLQVGQIAFNPPEMMKVGKPERVEVRITRERNTDFVSTMKGRGHPQVEELKVYEFMRVDLSGDDFTIIPLNEPDQIIASTGFTEWAWTVTPSKRGKKVLHLHVSLRIKLPDTEKTKGHPVIDKAIVVKVNPAYSGKRFIKENWKWLMTALVIPLAGLIWKSLK
ncbi:hypothetical protein FCL47_09945 [Desulfopila sp. IMCC35006]|uniref:hypothetical protein n=1 Tax=Desulfopila sp. IMCC35006 TaxID=2569542 RepID=UPI0010AC7579|nr:hypothetical protein [Desulfopila sp. IMCC35006]TKB26064.1 hypothetical protein FCL47_09945 [Desulfopila sp. IMCC35006]